MSWLVGVTESTHPLFNLDSIKGFGMEITENTIRKAITCSDSDEAVESAKKLLEEWAAGELHPHGNLKFIEWGYERRPVFDPETNKFLGWSRGVCWVGEMI